MQHKTSSKKSFYRPRNHEASPFFKVVQDHFDAFEKVYPERYQEKYGFWRPVIRTSIDKFLHRLKDFAIQARATVSPTGGSKNWL